MEPLLKSRQWLVALGVLLLVLAALVGLILTSDRGALEATQNSRTHRRPLVDESPLETARAVAKLASDWDERRFADQALRLSDNAVDISFEDALRDATNHPVPPTPETRELYAHVSQAEADVKADQDQVNQLKKQLAAASGARQDSVQQQLDVAQAQMGLDQDELDDAKEDLARSGADPISRIQRQLKRHDDSEHATDAKPASAPTLAPDTAPQGASLLAQFTRWRSFRGRTVQLQQAHDETAQAAATLSQAHDSLEKQVAAEKASKQAIRPPAAGQSNPNPSGAASTSTEAAPTAIASLHRLSGDQKNLSDLDKRIQDKQELGTTYGNWIAIVPSHQRAALHGMILSALWIL